jgi:hypothetical protein
MSLRVVQGVEGDTMGWLDNWFGGHKPAPVVAQAQDGLAAMTLSERMAFRRQVVLESLREVMSDHGLLSPGYRASVARRDTRGHQFAVMIDLLSDVAGCVVDSPGELHAMEMRIAENALRRYRIKITGVYWRVVQESSQPVAASVSAEYQPLSKPTFLQRKTDHPEENGFPDTPGGPLSNGDDSVRADELAAFENALNESPSPQSVKLGRKTYDTDFSPLV